MHVRVELRQYAYVYTLHTHPSSSCFVDTGLEIFRFEKLIPALYDWLKKWAAAVRGNEPITAGAKVAEITNTFIGIKLENRRGAAIIS